MNDDFRIKRVSGYELIEIASNNVGYGSYVSWEISENSFFNREKFELDIRSIDEFNAVFVNIAMIYDELMFDSRYVLSQELFGYMFEYYDISVIHNLTMKLYKREWFEFIENPFNSFINNLCSHYSTDPEKIKVLTRLKLLHNGYDV